jgi:hypothetical protein
MKCPNLPLRTVVKIGANPHGSKTPDTSDGSKTVINQGGPPRSLANKALAMLRDQQIVTEQAQTASAPTDPAAGEIIAVLIDSPIVGPVWFALSDDFKSGDAIPVFFMSEIPHLEKMGPAELRRRYEQKIALGGGWIVSKQ